METLDCSGLECPMLIVELTKKIRKVKVGDELSLITTAEGSKEDVPVWCNRTGNELKGLDTEDGRFVFHIKKLK
jgi:tRNA 2-thiouridine synthesizing protein A